MVEQVAPRPGGRRRHGGPRPGRARRRAGDLRGRSGARELAPGPGAQTRWSSSRAPSGRARRTRAAPWTTCVGSSPAPWGSLSRSARSSAEPSARAWAISPATRCTAVARPPGRRWPEPSPRRAGSPPFGSRWPTCRPCTPRTRHTVNDVVLAVVTGGLRSWLLTRASRWARRTLSGAACPMSVTEDAAGPPRSAGRSPRTCRTCRR